MRNLLDSLPAGLIVLEPSGKIVRINRLAARLLEIDATEAVGRHWTALCPQCPLEAPDRPPALIHLQGLQVVFQHATLPTAAGPKTIILLQDVTGWDFFWQELEQCKATAGELEAIFNSSFDEILVMDGTGITQRINKVGETNYGIPADQMLGLNVSELENRGLFSPSVTNLVLREKRRVTITQRTSTGKQLIATGNPIFDDSGDISRIVVNSRDISELINIRQKLHQTQRLADNYYNLIHQLERDKVAEAKIVSASRQMQRIIELAERVAQADSTVLITGESGVGKGLIAARIHHRSGRRNGPFTPINCGAIPENLLESELFGYEKGAFTGANKEGKKGLIEISAGGTVFFDEVADIPLNVQIKLLNLIQDRKYFRVGGTRQITASVRFIAATNKNIQKMVADGTFREDLYYRLNVVPLVVPPLRYRREDIAPLLDFLLNQLNLKCHTNKRVSPGVLEAFHNYRWPGNVRELENILERLVVTSDEDLITESQLPESLLGNAVGQGKVRVSGICTLREAKEELERQLLALAYRKYGNSYAVARALDINQSTALRKIHKYRLN